MNELPAPKMTIAGEDPDRGHWYTAKQMEAYAAAKVAEYRADAERLDWLDTQRGDIVSHDGYGGQQLDGHCWGVEGQCSEIREAIDAIRSSREGDHDD